MNKQIKHTINVVLATTALAIGVEEDELGV